MGINIGIPRGTRDFGPLESARRNFILKTIECQFHKYGFLPLQTPAMENLDTLIGKYGEEGDQLLFKILNSGLHEQKNKDVILEKFKLSLEKHLHASEITDKALRYDLTVPFARYVSMHRQELPMPFRRYQIQPVWRADRPQKGRYREFYQCDADIIGTPSLLSEWELIRLADDVFGALKIPAELRWNHRKLLQAIADFASCTDRFSEFTLCLDKWDKSGKEGVSEEMKKRNFQEKQIRDILSCIEQLNGFFASDFHNVPYFIPSSPSGDITKNEISFIYALYKNFPLKHIRLVPDFTLARGLNYYTGFIFEAKALQGDFQPSILGGGRYDDLTGIFGQPGLSGVGISFGLDRIYDVMENLQLFPEQLKTTRYAFCLGLNMGEQSIGYMFDFIHKLRESGVPAFQFPENKKISKQFEYADKCGIPYAAIAGEEEIRQQSIQLKNLNNKEQKNLPVDEALNILKHEYFQHGKN
ncbi:MAG: histidine--tRNA ligase [Bacteroidia bacterium]|nr:histidine--tRNA ligase [Bacteroidia bacterium]